MYAEIATRLRHGHPAFLDQPHRLQLKLSIDGVNAQRETPGMVSAVISRGSLHSPAGYAIHLSILSTTSKSLP